MSLLKEFDLAIAKAERTPNGYRIGDRIFDSYLSNDAWDRHLAEMLPKHRRQFGDGSGGELEPKNGRPPKMASFASSSRMAYNLSKHIPGFVFEKKLTTTVGGIANLDGYIELPDKHIYIEAKCREPYSHSSEQLIKQNYRGIYEYLCEKMPDNFSCIMEDIPDEGKTQKRNMRVEFFCKGKSVAYFDIKQMICHLLAVATARLKNPDYKEALFLYLLFEPTTLKIANGVKENILQIYADTCQSAEAFDFNKMFSFVVDYLVEHTKLKTSPENIMFIKTAFCFKLCSQTTYASFIDK